MTTKNPRVAAYIQPETHERLKQYIKETGLTESKAIDVILGSYFGIEQPRMLLSTPGNIPDELDERLTVLEQVDIGGIIQQSLEAAIAPLKSEIDALKVELGVFV